MMAINKNLRFCFITHGSLATTQVGKTKHFFLKSATIMEINYWTNGKICAKVVFPRYTESVKFRS